MQTTTKLSLHIRSNQAYPAEKPVLITSWHRLLTGVTFLAFVALLIGVYSFIWPVTAKGQCAQQAGFYDALFQPVGVTASTGSIQEGTDSHSQIDNAKQSYSNCLAGKGIK